VLKGSVDVAGFRAEKHEALFLNLGEKVEAEVDADSRFVLIGGKPHGESVVLRGSFVY
ncbi:pirin family protein, partial [Candidatus Bathyarchaeota archaeon]|nr:pirin family protein [Candidatus Bathyarchaeota archaeon]